MTILPRLATALLVVLLLASARTAPPATPAAARPADRVTVLVGNLGEADLAALRAVAPNVNLLVGLSADEALARAAELDGIDGRYATPELLAAATKLRWVQSLSAGVERYLAVEGLVENDRIVLTNMAGVHGPTIADHAMGLLLTLTRDLAYHTDPARRGAWNRSGSGRPTVALADRTMLVVGLGGIGTEVARRAKGFGMTVLATRRSAVPPPPFVDRQGTPDDLDAFLREADVVVLCVPLTEATTGLIDAEALAAMPAGSYLINVARGRVVDTGALVGALESGHLAGAGLDVTDPEPLPVGHPLWTLPNVIITPHVSGRSELTRSQWRETFAENLRRFAAGEPLLNVVDKAAGY